MSIVKRKSIRTQLWSSVSQEFANKIHDRVTSTFSERIRKLFGYGLGKQIYAGLKVKVDARIRDPE